MSTTFRFTSTEEFAFTRWCGMSQADFDNQTEFDTRAAMDFGSERQRDMVEAAMMSGETVFSEDNPSEVMDFVEAFCARRMRQSFGEFVGTVEVGSGEMMRRFGMED